MSLKRSEVTYFLSALFVLCISYVNHSIVLILIGILGCLWLFYRKEYLSILISIFCVLFMYFLTVDYKLENTIEGKVIQKKDSYVIVDVGAYNVLVYDLDANFDDIVYVKGEAKEIVSVNNRVGFSFSDWCKAKKIMYAIYPSDSEIIKKGNSLRAKVNHKISKFNDKARSVMQMFLFHDYDEKIEWLYLGLSFGVHIAFVVRFIASIFHYFLLEEKVDTIELILYILFCLFYQFDFITIRLLIKCLLKKSNLSKHNQWGLLVIVLSILYPNMLMQVGFVLPIWIGLLNVFSHKRLMSSIDFLVIWTQLIYSGYISILQIICMKGIRYVFCWIYMFCFLNIWISFEDILVIFYEIIQYLSCFRFDSFILLGKPNVILTIVFVLCLVSCVTLSSKRKFIIIGVLILLNHFQNYFYPFARVVYVDVGQGDCTLITLPFNRGNILIDTGGSLYSDIAKDVVYPVLSSYGISSLDLVILTHDDLDHSGAFDSLQSLIPIKRVIVNKNEKYVVSNFEMYDLLYDFVFEDGNENSLTCLFTIYNSSFLVLGDIFSKQEEILVTKYDDLHVDYLKLAHHGSSTSTCDHLLESVRCDFALISCGKNNRYKHPSLEVVERLKAFQIDSLITSEVGMIEVIVTPFWDWIKMENEVILKYKCP